MNTPLNPQSAPSAPRKKHRNLAQSVVASIADSIRDGSSKPGDKLPTESELMRTQGVSRTVIREAISHLQASGLVETRHGIGTFVLAASNVSNTGNFDIDPETVITMRDILAILELRISLEAEAAGLAAARRNEEQLAQMRLALDAFQKSAHERGDSVAADVQFHLHIAQATGNRYFVDILSHLGTTIIPRTRINSARLAHDDPTAYLDRVHREHEDIYNAIVRQDADSARAAMRTHLSNSRERLRKVQDSMGSPS
ncbi:FadR/GntR family transcriptional regulator [Collimonas pratensis]|uniref:Bacterial regulatory s, gntR family protein n=1 Tax=Collimonas pratensis TaxID=279113 RepID=A0A127QR95_9BURK|nr:FadR/GntR family transcriptional regulator [Collimonas pratensis]AMP02651.1 bacterial regulatory s, gntR family protein [Collimonas pratensis]AMP12543.1 bacterial regulatory s, gntR family protein [Collimonas pratensis]NKI71079.1 FCD domain-containing protein [Collimonas pratensis]